MKSYNASEVTLVLAGIPIDAVGGYADGEFCTVKQDTADFGDKVGTDGTVTRFKTNDKRATVEVKLMQSSSANALLSNLNNLDVNAPNGAGVGTFLLKDRQGTSLYTGTSAWISKPPDVSFNREATERVWIIRVANLVRLDGGN